MAEHSRSADLIRLDRLLSMQRYIPRLRYRPAYGLTCQRYLASTTVTDVERDIMFSLAQAEDWALESPEDTAEDGAGGGPSPMGFTVSIHDGSGSEWDYNDH